jgi:hypothetical protein
LPDGWRWDDGEAAWIHESGAQVRRGDDAGAPHAYVYWYAETGDVHYVGHAESLGAAMKAALRERDLQSDVAGKDRELYAFQVAERDHLATIATLRAALEDKRVERWWATYNATVGHALAYLKDPASGSCGDDDAIVDADMFARRIADLAHGPITQDTEAGK